MTMTFDPRNLLRAVWTFVRAEVVLVAALAIIAAAVLTFAGIADEMSEGEAHALLGINGAGKSTMIKILSGVYAKDSGEILLCG